MRQTIVDLQSTLLKVDLCTGWRRETGTFEVDYEIPPRGQVPSARGFVTLKRLVRNFETKSLVGVYCLYVSQKTLMLW
jgi:hypothetical protein